MSKVKIIKLVNLQNTNKLFEYRERSNKMLLNLNYKGVGEIVTSLGDDDVLKISIIKVPQDKSDLLKSLFLTLCDVYTYYETHIGDKVMMINHECMEYNGKVNLFMEFKNIFGTESRVNPIVYTTPRVKDVVESNRFGGK